MSGLATHWFFVQTTTLPPNQNDVMVKYELLNRGNILGKYSVIRFCVSRRSDKRSGVLIGAGGIQRPDWPERV